PPWGAANVVSVGVVHPSGARPPEDTDTPPWGAANAVSVGVVHPSGDRPPEATDTPPWGAANAVVSSRPCDRARPLAMHQLEHHPAEPRLRHRPAIARLHPVVVDEGHAARGER